MPVIMTALNLKKNGEWGARKSIPADARPEYKRLFGVSWEAVLRVPKGTSKSQAKAQHGQWLAEVETRIERIRSSAKGEGIPLTKLNAVALAGQWYAWFVDRQQGDDLKSPKHWRAQKDHFLWQVLSPHAPDEHHCDNSDPSWPWLNDPKVRLATAPYVREAALTASFLASGGIALAADADALFVAAVSDILPAAYDLLERRADNDYSADRTPETFPAYEAPAQRKGAKGGMGCWELFSSWVAAVEPAAGTVQRWRAVFKDLEATFPDQSAASVSEADAEAWAGKLVTPKRSAVTVAAVWVPSAKTVFAWAVGRKHIPRNPFSDIKIIVPKADVLRETKAFTPEETQVILRASSAVTNIRDAFPRAKRWAMWLCAYAGTRSGEITQLRGSDITSRNGFFVMRLTPEAGSIKTYQARTVPLHEHLIAQGFIEFVKAQGDGPLFYNPRPSTAKPDDPLHPRLSPAGKARARLSVWVRALGISDPEVSPTHGWRHSFKQIAERAGISEKMSDAITGHAPATIGRSYGAPTVEDMSEALKKFPRYVFADPQLRKD